MALYGKKITSRDVDVAQVVLELGLACKKISDVVARVYNLSTPGVKARSESKGHPSMESPRLAWAM